MSNSFGMAPQLAGSPEQVAEGMRAYAAAGSSRLVVWLTPNTLAGIDEFATVLELLDRQA